MKKAIAFLFVCGGLASCSSTAWINAAELLASKIACAIENQDLPNDQIIAKCAVQPGDVERVLAIVGDSRKASAKAAAQAADRASAAKCGDAGAP